MRKIFFILFLSAVMFNASFAAQSPYELYASQDNLLLGGAAVGGLTAWLLNGGIEPLTAEQIAALDREDINAFDRPATYNYSEHSADLSDWGLRLFIVLPAALMADAKMRSDAATVGMLYLETMALAGVATELTKVSVRRIRPYAYNPEVPLHDKMARDTRKSFFSGHTSTSFAAGVFFAKVFEDYYPESRWRPYVWAGSLGLASIVACWRVNAGRHFRTDVLVGALVGGTVAWLVPEMHKKTAAFFSIANSPDRPRMIGVRFAF